jgi:mannonate dehydratase
MGYKGKRANMPVYQLLGGKCRIAVDCYAHAGGPTPEILAERVKQFMDQGFRHVRIQLGGYGGVGTPLKRDLTILRQVWKGSGYVYGPA